MSENALLPLALVPTAGLLAWLVTYLVHSTLLLLVLRLALRFVRADALRLRERLLAIGLFGALATASLQLALGLDPWPGRLPLPAGEVAAVAGDERTTDAGPAGDAAEATRDVPAEDAPAGPSRAAATPPSGEEPDPGAEPPPVPREPELVASSANGPRIGRGIEPRRGGVAAPSWRSPRIAEPRPAKPAPARELRSGSPEDRTSAPSARSTTPEPSRAAGSAAPAAPGPDAPPAVLRTGATGTSLLRADEVVPAGRSPRGPTWIAARLLAGGALLWLAAAVLVTALFVALSLRFAGTLRGRRVLTSGSARRLLNDLLREARLGREVRLSVSARVPTPLTFGLLRPEICVPERATRDLTPAQLRALLAHELAHVVRRDPLRFGAIHLVTSVFFLQPLHRSTRRQLLETAEVLCDDQAIRWTGDRLALASCLAQVAGWVVGPVRRPLLSAGMASAGWRLGERIERLLDDRRSPVPERPPVVASLLALGLLGGTAWAVPGARWSPVPSPRVEAPTAAASRAPEPAPAPALAPAARPLPASAAPLVPLTRDLERELELFERELDLLRESLGRTELSPALARRLDEILARTDHLADQRARVHELVLGLARAHASDRSASPPDPLPEIPR